MGTYAKGFRVEGGFAMIKDMLNKELGFIDFLSGNAVIKVTNEHDYNHFVKLCEYYRLRTAVFNGGKFLLYERWQELAKLNNKNPDLFLFEFSKGSLTWSDDEERAKSWWGEENVIPIGDLRIA